MSRFGSIDEMRMRWLKRGWEHFNSTEPLYGHKQSFFPIVQGCTFPDLRHEAASRVAELGADGNAIGGLAVGEPAEKMYEMIEVVNPALPALWLWLRRFRQSSGR